MKSTFSILFYIDRSKTNERKDCVIRCRITCNGASASFSTGLYTSPDDWQAKIGRMKVVANRANAVNLQLDSIDERLHALYERTLRKENYITAEYLKEQYLRYMKPTPTLIELYQSLCESKKDRPIKKQSWHQRKGLLLPKRIINEWGKQGTGSNYPSFRENISSPFATATAKPCMYQRKLNKSWTSW